MQSCEGRGGNGAVLTFSPRLVAPMPETEAVTRMREGEGMVAWGVVRREMNLSGDGVSKLGLREREREREALAYFWEV